MKDIDNHVIEKWASKWKQLGSQLNVGEHVIRHIECDHHEDCERCCRIMLSKWLEETVHPTWGLLINALDKVSDNATGLFNSYCYSFFIYLYKLGKLLVN